MLDKILMSIRKIAAGKPDPHVKTEILKTKYLYLGLKKDPFFTRGHVRLFAKRACMFFAFFGFAAVLIGGASNIPDSVADKRQTEKNAVVNDPGSLLQRADIRAYSSADLVADELIKGDIIAIGSFGGLDTAAENVFPQPEKASLKPDTQGQNKTAKTPEGENSENTAERKDDYSDAATPATTGKEQELTPVIADNGSGDASAAALSEGFIFCDQVPMSRELQEYTYEKCTQRGLEYPLILAVMWRESRFRTDAVHINANGTRDSGIMQINDVNRGWLNERHGISDLMDPYQNIDAGTAMLGDFTRKYGSHNALLAYQYGEAGMKRQIARGITTNKLVELAYSRRDYYKQLFEV